MQTQLALRQQEMATMAYQLYSATYIQSIYRGWKARLRLKTLVMLRFLGIFLVFRFRFRRIRRAQIRISRCYRHWIRRKKFFRLIQMCSAAIKIQRQFRTWFFARRAIIRVVSHRVWQHVKLFAFTKAKRVIQPFEKYRYVLNSFLGGYVRRRRLIRSRDKEIFDLT